MTRLLALLCFVACSSPAAPVATPQPPDRDPEPIANTEPAPPVDAAPALTLAEADCRGLRSAPALAIATVTTSQSDCSSIGHLRVVLDVNRLVRGQDITRVATSQPLYPRSDTMRVGAIQVIGIQPAVTPAATVQCVAIPAHEGSVLHAVPAASTAEAERIVAALATCEP